MNTYPKRRNALPEPTEAMTAANATHDVHCAHARNMFTVGYYTMPCHVLGTTPGGKVKIAVFGDRFWQGVDHVKRVRYVEAGKVVKKK